ncbi:DUF3519 domain-containing protein [Helicobacter pylori]|uniref:DUF3519 domain-containing protein n=1 Tax=Helicobacter pylori TaxID=210 RepID=UPI001ABB4A53|nr:DUF3519 domain-containing protein [Helicobacter pylori]
MKLPKALNEATAGAALKYHLKRALERSHSISEFSKNLELSAQNAKFSNNTLKIIEELTNGVKQASEEIKVKARDFSNQKLTNEQIKELLNNAEIPTSGRDAITFGVNNLNHEIVEFLHKNNKKMIIEKASNKELELLQNANFKQNIRASLDHDAITHILKRHGVNSVNVKNGESPITYEDIANYRYIVNHADAILRTLDKYNQEAITAFKQINGYAVVVEQAINKKNELVLKTMFKSNGDYKNNDVFKEFSSTSLDANAKVPHGLSSHGGATENPTQKPLTSQEDLLKTSENLNETTPNAKNLSPLELANAEKLAKLESEAKVSEQEFLKAKEQEAKRKVALKKKLEHERGNAGNIESQTKIEVGEDIPTQIQERIPKSRVRLNEREIYDLNYAIVKAKDLKPSFTTGGTQKRTDMNEEQIKSIAENFDPKKIFGSGGFEDLPIILHDGQVIAGNHRIQGMLNFNAESRKKYEQTLKENFNIKLKPNELLVRMPEQELNDKEILKLASKSNENRANSFSDMLLSAMSSYNDKLKHLPPKFESDSVENLANQVARVLERDSKIPSANQVENANLSLLSHYARNTPNNSFLEVFDNAYKNLDREQFKAFKEMFANNSANFHNLNNDTTIKNFTISPYLTDALDTTAKMLESGNRADNFSKLVNDIDYLVNSTDENGMNAFIKENKDAYNSVISELLGSSFARFLRLENPSVQFYEFLVKAKDRMIENAADIFTGTSKPISQINIFDFIKYGIESGKSSKESRELLDLLPKLEKKFNAHEKFLKGNKK